jgi:hypothetical protein
MSSNLGVRTCRGVTTMCSGPHGAYRRLAASNRTTKFFSKLGKFLSREEALWLYTQLQKSRRSESEWRAEFLWLFRQVSPADLPPLRPGEALDEYPGRRDEWLPGPPPPDVEIPF